MTYKSLRALVVEIGIQYEIVDVYEIIKGLRGCPTLEQNIHLVEKIYLYNDIIENEIEDNLARN